MLSCSVRRRSFRPRVEPLEDRALPSVCTVDRLTDLGEGKDLVGDLRYCLSQTKSGVDYIDFSITGILDLTNDVPLPQVNTSLSIVGPGADLLTVRRTAAANYRIFTLFDGDFFLAGLTIANGRTFFGGGGISNGGTLTVSGCVLAENVAAQSQGGGIYNAGTLVVVNSTRAGNSSTASIGGGGILNVGTLVILSSTVTGNLATGAGEGGGILNEGTLIVVNSTVSGNRAIRGGGIYHDQRARVMTLDHSTLTDNFAADGGGLGIHVIARSPWVRNTLIAGNSGSAGPDVSGQLASLGHNLIGDPNGGSGFVDTDLLNVNPLLGPLANNGGPTLTHALLPGSPAINAADPAGATSLGFPKWDQRGAGFYRVADGRMDIGAFEVQGRRQGFGAAELAGALGTAPAPLSGTHGRSGSPQHHNLDEDRPAVTRFGFHGHEHAGVPEELRFQTIFEGSTVEAQDLDLGGDGDRAFLFGNN